jgi:hypothetical protein
MERGNKTDAELLAAYQDREIHVRALLEAAWAVIDADGDATREQLRELAEMELVVRRYGRKVF